MYGKKVITTSLAILVFVTAVSLVTASSGSGLVTSAFAVKKDTSATTTGTSKKSTSGTSATSTGSKSKFIKCVTAISGSLSRTEVDNCWNQVFGSGGSSSGLILGPGTSSGSSSSSSGHSSGHGGTSNGGSSA